MKHLVSKIQTQRRVSCYFTKGEPRRNWCSGARFQSLFSNPSLPLSAPVPLLVISHFEACLHSGRAHIEMWGFGKPILDKHPPQEPYDICRFVGPWTATARNFGKNKNCLVIATFSGEISRFELSVMVSLLNLGVVYLRIGGLGSWLPERLLKRSILNA